jgi:hypothetical protein
MSGLLAHLQLRVPPDKLAPCTLLVSVWPVAAVGCTFRGIRQALCDLLVRATVPIAQFY